MTRSRPLAPLALLLVATAAAFAGGEPADPKKKPDGGDAGMHDGAKPSDWKGPDIAWARSYAEARDEAMERGVPIYVHSHGST